MLTQRKSLTTRAVKKIAEAAEATAAQINVPVVISIFDEGANLLYLLRMEGAPLGSVTVAQDKARSAALFNFPTKEYENWLSGGLTSILKLDMLPFEGGIPLLAGRQLVGAIGVSGGTAQQDGQISQSGAQWFADEIAKGA